MSMLKIATIIGARPQFIKAAIVNRAFRDVDIDEVIVHTGQHFETNMSDVFFEELQIEKPRYNLKINSLSHASMIGQMMEKIEKVLLEEEPDLVLVYGDTNSTLAGALTARKLKIKTVHVEAGLRSLNMEMPEEVNRIITDRISDILFCPTEKSIQNLQEEGFNRFDCQIVFTGDVMFDAALHFRQYKKRPKDLLPDTFVLCTVHRAENTDNEQNLTDIFSALETIASEEGVVIPLHPRTRCKLQKIGFDFAQSKITFIPPVGYLEMLWLLSETQLVMTDSGGLQKEASFFDKYCITLRNETEWTELVDAGYNILAGSSKANILQAYHTVTQKERTVFNHNLYGNGKATEIIKECLCQLKKENK